MLSTRSVGMSLARRFNAGIQRTRSLRRLATAENIQIQASLRDGGIQLDPVPGVETPG